MPRQRCPCFVQALLSLQDGQSYLRRIGAGPFLAACLQACSRIGASAGCAGPLILVLLGVGGAWGSRLVTLEPLQPSLIAAAVVFFGLAFRRLYQRSLDCLPGEACSVPAARRWQRRLFRVLGLAAAALISFPLYVTAFYR